MAHVVARLLYNVFESTNISIVTLFVNQRAATSPFVMTERGLCIKSLKDRFTFYPLANMYTDVVFFPVYAGCKEVPCQHNLKITCGQDWH